MGSMGATDELGTLEPFAAAARAAWRDEAFAALFQQYYARLVGIVVRMLGDRAQAEEIAGDAFWKLYQRPALQAEGNNLPAWLYRTATRMGLDALRARRRGALGREQIAAEMRREGSGLESPLGALVRREQAETVRQALRQLKPAQAAILVLRYSGLTYAEVAAALKMNPGSVGTTLARAEAAFERCLSKEDA